VLSASAVAIVGCLDYLTGFEISFSVFYLLPVGIAAWYAGPRSGAAFAVIASLTWYVADLAAGQPYQHPAIPVWNAFVRLCFFLIIASLLATLREGFRSERLLAKTDALTGALNLRAFEERLGHDLDLTARSGSPLTLAYIDLDDFKRINDAYGHHEGDRLLQAVSRTLAGEVRRSDSLARLGGDEFALILPGTDLDGATALMAKLRRQLGELGASNGPAITCSIGAVVFHERPSSAGDAVAAADRLMYAAKNHGKNAVFVDVYSRSAVAKT
jgi:diguanylate cyclase (GGDEF)-like protein